MDGCLSSSALLLSNTLLSNNAVSAFQLLPDGVNAWARLPPVFVLAKCLEACRRQAANADDRPVNTCAGGGLAVPWFLPARRWLPRFLVDIWRDQITQRPRQRVK